MSTKNCDTLEYMNRYRPIVYQQIFQILCSLSSIFIVFFGRLIQKPAYFHPNVKILIKLFQFSILLYSFNNSSSQLYHLLTAQIFENCEFLISTRICFPFRFICTASVTGFCLFPFSIPIERAIATKNLGKGYENRKANLGAFVGYCSIMLSIAFSLFHHLPNLSIDVECDNCLFSTPPHTVPQHLSIFGVACSTVALVLIFGLLCYNRAQLTRKTYSLSSEFQINQNLRILHLVLPMSFLTFLLFLCISVSELYFQQKHTTMKENQEFIQLRSWKMAQNIFPIYTVLCSLVWLAQMLYERKKRKLGNERLMASLAKKGDERNVYFQTLQNQWAYPTNKKMSTVLPRSTVPTVSSSQRVSLTDCKL